MENGSSATKSHICGFERAAEISIFGKTLAAKNYICSKNGCPYKEKQKPLKLQLSVIPTSFCGGRCPFCVAAGTKGKKEFLDLGKLERTLVPLHEKNILRGIGITGGEPFTDVELLNDIVELIFDIFGIEFEIYINTNGSGLRDMHRLRRLEFIDAIHISRHHYDDEKNRSFFLGKTVSGRGKEQAKYAETGTSDRKFFETEAGTNDRKFTETETGTNDRKFSETEAGTNKLKVSGTETDRTLTEAISLCKPEIPGEQELKELVKSVYDPRLFVYNCLLLKDGIGTKEDMAEMLEFAARTGVPKVGFVTPMPVNEYVKKNMVSYRDLFDREDDRFLFTTAYDDFEYCHCQDGLYFSRGGRLVRLYGRETAFGNAPYVRGLVYGADNVLRTGFSETSETVFRP